MKTCLIVGTINHYPAPDGWRHIHVDKSERGIWDAQQGRQVPIDIRADMRGLPYPADSIDRIQCWHALEHVNEGGGHQAVTEFARVLRSGGELDVVVPDIAYAAEQIVAGNIDAVMGSLYGEQLYSMPDYELNAHLWGYTPDSLAALLRQHGFEPGEPIRDGDVHYVAVRL